MEAEKIILKPIMTEKSYAGFPNKVYTFEVALDANKVEMTRWGFSAGGDSLVQQERVRLDEDVLRPLDFAQYDDTTFIIPDYSGDSRLCRVSRQGKLLGKWGQIPSSDEDALQNARPALAQAWRSFIDYNPRNGVLAAATQLGEVLEVWNLRDNTHVVCTGPNGEPQFQVAESVVDQQVQRVAAVSLPAVERVVDQYADSRPPVEGVEGEQIDAADGGGRVPQLDDQAQLSRLIEVER